MNLRYFILIFVLLFPTANLFAEGSCAIDGQLSPRLAEYVRGVETLVGQLKQQPSSCGGRSNGVVSNSKRVLDVFDKAKAEFPMTGDITLDFEYNIKIAFNGESRAGVMENGKIFARVEQTLVSALDVLANKCNLDGTNEGIITNRIKLNHALESLYKNTALGYPGNNPGDIPDNYQDVAAEIQKTYNPTATQGCKNQYSFEKMSETIMKKIGSIGTGIEKGLKDWKYAIALIRGGTGIREEEYNALKKNLLTQELQRQGFSAGTIGQMVKGYNCVEAAMQGDDENPAMGFAAAKTKCIQVSVLGVDRFMKEWKKMLLGSKGAKTIISYIRRLDSYKSLQENNVNTAAMYTSIQAIFAENTFIDDEMITKLIDLHIALLDANDRIERRIPTMQGNCMKAQPGITGGCVKK